MATKQEPNVLVIQTNQDHAAHTYAGTVASSQSQYSGYRSYAGTEQWQYTGNG